MTEAVTKFMQECWRTIKNNKSAKLTGVAENFLEGSFYSLGEKLEAVEATEAAKVVAMIAIYAKAKVDAMVVEVWKTAWTKAAAAKVAIKAMRNVETGIIAKAEEAEENAWRALRRAEKVQCEAKEAWKAILETMTD